MAPRLISTMVSGAPVGSDRLSGDWVCSAVRGGTGCRARVWFHRWFSRVLAGRLFFRRYRRVVRAVRSRRSKSATRRFPHLYIRWGTGTGLFLTGSSGCGPGFWPGAGGSRPSRSVWRWCGPARYIRAGWFRRGSRWSGCLSGISGRVGFGGARDGPGVCTGRVPTAPLPRRGLVGGGGGPVRLGLAPGGGASGRPAGSPDDRGLLEPGGASGFGRGGLGGFAGLRALLGGPIVPVVFMAPGPFRLALAELDGLVGRVAERGQALGALDLAGPVVPGTGCCSGRTAACRCRWPP